MWQKKLERRSKQGKLGKMREGDPAREMKHRKDNE